MDKNPIKLVRKRTDRRETPRRLAIVAFQILIANLSEPSRTMAILAACLSLRIGEILGLQLGRHLSPRCNDRELAAP